MKSIGIRIFSLAQLWSDLRNYYLLLVLLIVVGLAAVISYTLLAAPVYTATAIVGPANNSDQPFNDAVGSLSGGLGGIAKHLHVGGALGQQGGGDPFDEYTALLTSNRLAALLVRKDNFLPEVFWSEWDASQNHWLPKNDFASQKIDQLKVLLRRPVKPSPDQEDLEKYFKKNLLVDSSLETSFTTVSFRFHTRDGAERLLGLILREADNIIREDKRRDVAARIAYLNAALVHLALADQKPELIAVLSEQEQEMMMIESDHLYASMLIDAPYAPLTPTSPSPVIDGLMAMALACVIWIALVRVSPAGSRTAWFIAIFARGKRGPHAGKQPRSVPKFRDDPLADALPISAVLNSTGNSDAVGRHGVPGKGRL
ncbi:MAG TPA: Wzz/FepE/Etk N-terminal domain-containing protein [Rhizomicrobium sp.]|jgi:hypothetical protein|nr:Wzz/FepE/Etk N-terminal domain-containing protein [Rhizomicrobium sp.]